MSAAAKKLASAPPSAVRVRRGPSGVCGGVYEPDLEDSAAIDEFRRRPGESWSTAQTTFDRLLGVKQRIPNDKFRYHWRRKCFCWPDELRQA